MRTLLWCYVPRMVPVQHRLVGGEQRKRDRRETRHEELGYNNEQAVNGLSDCKSEKRLKRDEAGDKNKSKAAMTNNASSHVISLKGNNCGGSRFSLGCSSDTAQRRDCAGLHEESSNASDGQHARCIGVVCGLFRGVGCLRGAHGQGLGLDGNMMMRFV